MLECLEYILEVIVLIDIESNDVGNAKIKVIGVGGGGNNAVIRIINEKVQNIQTYLINTETTILKRANTPNIIQIGKQTTKGLGARSRC